MKEIKSCINCQDVILQIKKKSIFWGCKGMPLNPVDPMLNYCKEFKKEIDDPSLDYNYKELRKKIREEQLSLF